MDTTATGSRGFPFLFPVPPLVYSFTGLNSQSERLASPTGSAANSTRLISQCAICTVIPLAGLVRWKENSNKVCGLSCVTRSWCLETDSRAPQVKCHPLPLHSRAGEHLYGQYVQNLAPRTKTAVKRKKLYCTSGGE